MTRNMQTYLQRNTKKTTLLAVLITLTLTLTLAAGCGMRRHGEFDPVRVDKQVTGRLDDYLDDVKASDAQKTRILAIKDRLMPQAAALAASQKKVREEVAAQLASDRPDAARLHALVDQQMDAIRALAHKSVDGVVEAHSTLSPEQRAPAMKKMRRLASR